MSFLQSIKNFLNIGGVKLSLESDRTFDPNSGAIKGAIAVSSKSDKKINSLEISLVEVRVSGRGDSKTRKTQTLGKTVLDGLDIKAGESKNMEFDLAFEMKESYDQSLAKEDGIKGGLGKLATFANNTQSFFELSASAEVEGTALGPNDVFTLEAAA